MRIRASSFFLFFVLLLMLVFIVTAVPFQYLESKLLPLTVASIVFVLAAIQLGRETLAKDKSQPAAPTEELEQKSKAREALRLESVLGWVAGYVLGIYLLGFLIAIPLLVLSFLKVRGRRWLTAILVAAVTTFFMYVFEIGMGVKLYRGLIFGG